MQVPFFNFGKSRIRNILLGTKVTERKITRIFIEQNFHLRRKKVLTEGERKKMRKSFYTKIWTRSWQLKSGKCLSYKFFCQMRTGCCCFERGGGEIILKHSRFIDSCHVTRTSNNINIVWGSGWLGGRNGQRGGLRHLRSTDRIPSIRPFIRFPLKCFISKR